MQIAVLMDHLLQEVIVVRILVPQVPVMDYITKSNSHSTVFHFIIYLTIMYKKNKILLTIGLFLLVGI